MGEKLFEVYDYGKMRSDCTRSGKVKILRPCTVAEFLEECLGNDENWGIVGVYLPEEEKETRRHRKAFFGDLTADYRYGKLERMDSEMYYYLGRFVKEATYDGGFTRDDYRLYI